MADDKEMQPQVPAAPKQSDSALIAAIVTALAKGNLSKVLRDQLGITELEGKVQKLEDQNRV